MVGTMSILTCDGCGGHNLKRCEPTEAEMTIRRLGGNKVLVPIPLPLLCLDCGGTSHTFRVWKP